MRFISYLREVEFNGPHERTQDYIGGTGWEHYILQYC